MTLTNAQVLLETSFRASVNGFTLHNLRIVKFSAMHL